MSGVFFVVPRCRGSIARGSTGGYTRRSFIVQSDAKAEFFDDLAFDLRVAKVARFAAWGGGSSNTCRSAVRIEGRRQNVIVSQLYGFCQTVDACLDRFSASRSLRSPSERGPDFRAQGEERPVVTISRAPREASLEGLS